MYLAAPQLEPVLLKRLENWQSSGSAPTLGLAHCLTGVLQANSSAAGLEWSSTDGHDEAHLENVKVDMQDVALAQQLEAWQAWLSAGGAVNKPQYYAAAHALVQDILSSILNCSEPLVQQSALDAAWQEDAAGGSQPIPAERFKASLAALATGCSADGTPQAAATCLSSLLQGLKGQATRWQGLLERYSSGAASGTAAETAAAGAGAGDDDIDIDALLREDDDGAPDVTPASDKSPASTAAGGLRQQQQPSAFAAAGKTAAADGDAAAAAGAEGDDEEDDALFGLSRTASQEASAATAAVDAAAARRARQVSTKSAFDEDNLPLSGTNSADLGELPADLDAAVPDPNLMHHLAGGGAAAGNKTGARQPALAEMMASEEGKGHLAELPTDPFSWANFKDKDRPPPGAGGTALRAGGRSQAAPLVPLPGRGDAAGGGKQAPDQHLKAARGAEGGQPPLLNARTDGPKANPLHNAIINSNAVRQSVDREATGAAVITTPSGGPSRHGSNGSPVRQRSSASSCTPSSRKVSVSEPGPMGPQAEWKHLPALGQASRLHPHELRNVPGAPGLPGGKPPSTALMAAALVEPKLPTLPSLGGARGPPPKAMELLRRPSQAARAAEQHPDNSHHVGPKPHLPGLNGGPGGLKGAPGPRQFRMPSKKSFRGDCNF
ncbi:hypothetical protein Agub_g4538 [Astrephomene gubernaculifera]|uniref:Uncharacterized protein n=1 Tax=Astrephomene gubernaculifera TaxID=47775 RepID=A0AAD3DKA2_9CHLO|nr:hypothetical protein Agub_g4538 [Astrephomene gubernaculifera]